jgi:hypothetical protein
MFVEGVFGASGNTDISIQVPLSNIHKPDSTLDPVNIGTDTKAGRSIYLRGRPGPDGNIKFKLDLFNKFNKEKEEKINSLQTDSLKVDSLKIDLLKVDSLKK